MFGEEEIVKSHKPRADRIAQAILIAFSLLLMRLWYLQIVKGDLFYEFSLNNKIRKEYNMECITKILIKKHYRGSHLNEH